MGGHPDEIDQSGAPWDAEIYAILREIAARQFRRRERADHTLQPTAVVHEAYLRLSNDASSPAWSRTRFVQIAARQIRQILVDHARRRKRLKRGGDRHRVTLVTDLASPDRGVDLLALDDALDALDAYSSEAREIVELKFFGGLTEPEIAQVLDMSERTVRRRWTFARSWLYRELTD
jgi:RNA polymerase sigma-70 factor, ECF subfamily